VSPIRLTDEFIAPGLGQ